jgi:hypothetical protein
MDKPLKEHISRLEQRIQALNEQIMSNRLRQEERNRLEAEIRAANLAITHYKAAIELEKSLT